ncbi:hypothetical protein SKAU_G00125470 [Synaphobranchus kaupii]|uniref:Uncharacterized protein n=1 Tax=Synaphobranchus kaupii TaxID=118154 RepID=A0A9Q1FPC9_SYNKA|nr:hypothetical protein SKAU_G00125470 [Synaphobranchus kaupii]
MVQSSAAPCSAPLGEKKSGRVDLRDEPGIRDFRHPPFRVEFGCFHTEQVASPFRERGRRAVLVNAPREKQRKGALDGCCKNKADPDSPHPQPPTRTAGARRPCPVKAGARHGGRYARRGAGRREPRSPRTSLSPEPSGERGRRRLGRRH